MYNCLSATFMVKFDKAGTYTYRCTIHPFIQATVVVGTCAVPEDRLAATPEQWDTEV